MLRGVDVDGLARSSSLLPVVYILGAATAVIGAAAAGLMFRKTARGLVSGRIRSSSTYDHVQAVEQIQAMRGPGHERKGAWDGVDRLGGAGADRSGGSI